MESQRAKSPIRVKFGTAGIRGLFGQDVSLRETIAVCFAVHQLLGEGRFGLGYDTRKSSFILGQMACSAMNWYGSDVDLYGVIPTPVLAFNIKRNRLHAGFSVTASHNPPEYAGVKVFGTDGIEFSLEAEHEIEELIQKSANYMKREEELVNFGATFENDEAISSYRESVLKNAVPAKKKLHVLVDCGNGTSVGVTPSILSELGHRVVTVNSHQSPTFPGRLPEPNGQTLQEVARFSRSIGVDFTIAHDGDADRLVMIDEVGRIVPDYAVSALILKIVLEKVKRGIVIMSVNSSDALERIATDSGCRVVRSRLGKTFQELYQRRGIFATEPGKMVDPRWGYWEDGIYAAVMVSQYISELGVSLSSVLESIPKYYNYQHNLKMSSALDSMLAKELIGKQFGGGVELEELDGIKVRFKDGRGWFMLRSSGTERKARVYVESSSESDAKRILGYAVSIATASEAVRSS